MSASLRWTCPAPARVWVRVFDRDEMLLREERGKPGRSLSFDPPLDIPAGGRALVVWEPVDGAQLEIKTFTTA